VNQRKLGTGEADEALSVRTEELAASLPPDRLAERLPGRRQPADPPPAAPEGPKGRNLGKFHLIATLGRGGMADVHLAVSTGPAGFSKLQVIKCLRSSDADEPELRDMLLDEARLAARLNHRNVVQTNEVGIEDGEYFLAMEYLDGQPLSRLLARARERERSIPLAITLWILSEALEGLHYAHELTDYTGAPLHVVHRDVSPHNIFVTYDGQVKVVDFGIALAAQRAVETQSGILKGKVSYMAPEQAFSPSSEIDRRADIFSVGVILWEILAGHRLWRGLSDAQIISRLMRDVPDVRSARSETPFELSRICSRALARERDARYATAAELRAELLRYIDRLGEQVTAAQAGEIVAELFREERAAIRALVDRQLHNLERSAEEGADWSRSGRRASLPPIGPVPGEDEITAASPTGKSGRTPSQQATTVPLSRYGEEQGRGPLPLIAAAVAVVGLIAGGALLLGGRGAGEPSPGAGTDATQRPEAPLTATAAARPAATPAGAEAPAGKYIRVRVAANPSSALILIDGSELPSNPFESKFAKDDAAHRIEVRAAGFQSQSRMVVFDRDIDLDVLLQPAPRQGAQGPGEDPWPSGPATTTTPTTTQPPGDPGIPPPKPDPY
jgi:serine/threonine-protein kinase